MVRDMKDTGRPRDAMQQQQQEKQQDCGERNLNSTSDFQIKSAGGGQKRSNFQTQIKQTRLKCFPWAMQASSSFGDQSSSEHASERASESQRVNSGKRKQRMQDQVNRTAIGHTSHDALHNQIENQRKLFFRCVCRKIR